MTISVIGKWRGQLHLTFRVPILSVEHARIPYSETLVPRAVSFLCYTLYAAFIEADCVSQASFGPLAQLVEQLTLNQ